MGVYILIGVMSGLILGIPGGIFFYRKKLIDKSNKIRRRGILIRSFLNSVNGEYEASIQLAEVEKVGDKSRISIMKIVCDKSVMNNDQTRGQLKGMFEGTWVDSSEVDWIDDEARVSRNEILGEILNKN